jgi:hypothetical protein
MSQSQSQKYRLFQADFTDLYLPDHATSSTEKYLAMRKIQRDIETIYLNCPEAIITNNQASLIRRTALNIYRDLRVYIDLCNQQPPFFCTPLFRALQAIINACSKLDYPRQPLQNLIL